MIQDRKSKFGSDTKTSATNTTKNVKKVTGKDVNRRLLLFQNTLITDFKIQAS